MVSAQLYLKTFFAVMPERLKLIGELKSIKAEIDKRVLSGADLSSEDISQLIDIIGNDIFFRRAEKRKKYTLRHMNWKLLKSVEYFWEFYSKTFDREYDKVRKLRKVTNSEAIDVSLGKDILDLSKFFVLVLPQIKVSLEKTDSIYQRESTVLESILAGNENINAYKELLEEEKVINNEIGTLFLEIKKRNIKSFKVIK